MPPKKRSSENPSRPNFLGIKKFFSTKTSENVASSVEKELDSPHETENGSPPVEIMETSEVAETVQGVPSKPALKFQDAWITRFGPEFLKYDKTLNEMFCEACRREKMTNTMAQGTNNFKTTTITRHIQSSDHQRAMAAPQERANLIHVVNTAKTSEEQSIVTCMKIVYWMTKEGIPLSKYNSFLNFLSELGTASLENLKVNNNVTYASYKSACGFLDSMSAVIDRTVTRKLEASPALTIMTDESTDISVSHKLVLTARVLDPITLTPSTLFLIDLKITAATGRGIFEAIKTHLMERKIPVGKVSGLGTDGASVMTGRKEGLTGHFLRENPHLLNTHCSAHRVALCSEQAAEKVPGMKYYQGVMESLFYYFKKSPKRSDNLVEVQKLLEEPTLKCREVHQIRWLSFYQALVTVF